MLLAMLVLSFESLAQTVLRDGTWVLTKRVLPDGTVLVPPAIQGRASTKDGINQLLVVWQTPEGKQASISMLSDWSESADQITAKLIVMIFDDGSGKPPVYDLSGRTNTVPIARSGKMSRYQHPLNQPMIETDGNKTTAMVDGAFTDHWVRLN
ncbi:MAG: hypothetical protein ACKVP2_18625 [Burkholderiales bacterium]